MVSEEQILSTGTTAISICNRKVEARNNVWTTKRGPNGWRVIGRGRIYKLQRMRVYCR